VAEKSDDQRKNGRGENDQEWEVCTPTTPYYNLLLAAETKQTYVCRILHDYYIISIILGTKLKCYCNNLNC